MQKKSVSNTRNSERKRASDIKKSHTVTWLTNQVTGFNRAIHTNSI